MLRVITYLSLLIMTGCVQSYQPIISNSLYSLDNSKQQISKSALNSQPLTGVINSEPHTSVIPPKYTNFNGVVTITAQQRTIRLCHNDQIFNLQPNSHLLKQIKQLNKNKAYIEFEGQINQSLNPTHLRANISVEQLHYLSSQSKTSCKTPLSAASFQIIGSELNWRGYGQDNELTFIIKDLNSKWTIKKSVVTKGLHAFVETENDSGEQLNISFAGNGCIDNNNNYWQYETTVYLKNKQIKGCGQYPNQQDSIGNWLGHYRYKNNNVTIELALLAHHQANVRYLYNNGNEINESGYWHLYGSSGLKLLLTKRQENKANIVFHFRRDGVKLEADQQWRNNQNYSFNGSVLTLDRITESIKTESVFTLERNTSERIFLPENLVSPRVSTPAINNAIKRYFTMHKTKSAHSKYWFSEYDLNGNGRKDLLVMLDWCKTGGCVLLVFENKVNGYKFVSRISEAQVPIQISQTQNYQWQSLLMKNNQRWQQLDFNGINYPAKVSNGIQANKNTFTQVQLISNPLTADNAIPIK
ncbi:hypothetical protein HWV00_20200 [Moritella sp. 24]|uniref:hypothetical protein n=1 Tax=Moritella sp. 24 TaxID=2746230 RepID=UPI001BA7EB9C|nr:hypothetical protein [Moritella sp. 24]QUM78350.1 hypothetical protein HWV00_20200 [Moritella sp. 24]